MPHIPDVFVGAVAAAAFWTLIGLPAAIRVAPRPLAWFLAPALGWAVHAALALPAFSMIGLTPATAFATTMVLVAGAAVLLWRQRVFADARRPSIVLLLSVLAAAVLALVPMLGVLPKVVADGVALAPPIFDHSKIAMIDEMIRSGVPPINPFFSETGTPDSISYYYIWHFSAAVLALVTEMTGWEADAALTWFTAFASLLVMVGLAVAMARRASAGLIVVALASTASLREVIGAGLGEDRAHGLIRGATGLGGWLFQVSWAPQHLASATCVILAAWLMAQAAIRKDPALPLLIGLVVATAFQSSIWVGGVTFVLAAGVIAIVVLTSLDWPQRRRFLLYLLVAAVTTIVLVAPLLRDQLATAALRGGGFPIRIAPVVSLGSTWPAAMAAWLNPSAFWWLRLPIEFPAFYPAAIIVLLLPSCWPAEQTARTTWHTLALLLITSLVASWLLVSTIAENNDLGWRAILPAVQMMIIFAAVGVSRSMAEGRKLLPALAAGGFLLALPQTAIIVRENATGQTTPSSHTFIESIPLWQAVRRHTGKDDRIINDPQYLAEMTSWPVNISWALLANRRSCYAGNELAIAFAPLSKDSRSDVDALFKRVFNGEATASDVQELARRYRCDVAVVTAHDAAWTRNPFAAGSDYRLVEDAPGWRIYRRQPIR